MEVKSKTQMKSVYISPLTLLPKFQAKNVIPTPPYLHVGKYLYIFITTSGYYLYDNVGCTDPLKYRERARSPKIQANI